MREDSPFLKCDITMEVINLALELFKAEFPDLSPRAFSHRRMEFSADPFDYAVRCVAKKGKSEDIATARRIAGQALDRLNTLYQAERTNRREEMKEKRDDRKHTRAIDLVKAAAPVIVDATLSKTARKKKSIYGKRGGHPLKPGNKERDLHAAVATAKRLMRKPSSYGAKQACEQALRLHENLKYSNWKGLWYHVNKTSKTRSQ